MSEFGATNLCDTYLMAYIWLIRLKQVLEQTSVLTASQSLPAISCRTAT